MAHQERFRNSIFIALSFAFAACQSGPTAIIKQTPLVNAEKVELAMVSGIVLHEQKPFTGRVFTLFPRTADTSEVSGYLDGREHGQWKKFYRSTKIKEIRYFKNGQKIGFYQAWWENGNQQLEYKFVADEYEGECREWNEEGQLSRIMNYRKGQEEGKQQWWYDGGKIKANYVIKNGRRYGLLGTKNCINVSDSVFKN
ncbi:MAG: toxin-antitoxin system YwqK family antitoxin [Bacteroidia bacterium]